MDAKASDYPSNGGVSSMETRNSFIEVAPIENSVRQLYRDSTGEDNRQPLTSSATVGGEESDEEEVLGTAPNRNSTLLSTKTKSSLIDGLPKQDRRSGGGVAAKRSKFDEDELLLKGDIPD